MTYTRPTTEDQKRAALAELAVLELYDSRRRYAGHDYGSGQRAKELMLRRHDLGLDVGDARLELELGHLDADLVAAAFDRVARPRIRRLDVEGFRAETPTTRRTRETWAKVERRIAA